MNSTTLTKADMLKIAAITLAFLALLPLMVVVGWFARAVIVALVPIGLGLVLFSPRIRDWLDTESESRADIYKGLRLATDVILHRLHAWARVRGVQRVSVGADDLAQRTLGPVDRVVLPARGDRVRAGEPLFSLASGSRQLDVRAPMAGRVIRLNERLLRHPELANQSPYGAGWAVELDTEERVRPTAGSDARTFFRSEVDRLLGLLAPSPTAVPAMQDGGDVVADLHREIDEDAWTEIQTSFFGGPAEG